MTTHIEDYDMDYIILDLGSDVNILTRKTWEGMGKMILVWSPIHLLLANQMKVLPIGRLNQVPVEIEGLHTYAEFEVINIVDDKNRHTMLLGIHLDIYNQNIINFKKRILTFEYEEQRMVALLDPLEGRRYAK